ncbi:MAG: hypothetical protein ABIQ40_04790 [Bacteroidia bacterium]
MKYLASDIMKLLQEVAVKADMTLEYASFKEIYSKMEEELEALPFKEDYLYKRVYQEVKKMKDEYSEISLNSNYIEHIAKYLTYTNYDQFKKMQSQPFYSALENCLGAWYSYVRCNSGEEQILISPVLIFKEGREIFLQLKGPRRMFTGRLKLEGTCVYCLLESKEDKNLHLVFKFGSATKPDVLQGVFSGMSAAGDPIAGREILIRQKEKYGVLKNDRRPMKQMLESKLEDEKIIANYFKERMHCTLKGGRASTFKIDDLKSNFTV